MRPAFRSIRYARLSALARRLTAQHSRCSAPGSTSVRGNAGHGRGRVQLGSVRNSASTAIAATPRAQFDTEQT
jgi:hypothetical protein